MKSKRNIAVIILLLLLLITGVLLIKHHDSPKICNQTLGGGCLPEGMCVAPNDAVVDCNKLRQNPNKTDWP